MAPPFFLTRWLARSGAGSWLPGVHHRLGAVGPLVRRYSNLVLATPIAHLQAAAACLETCGPEVIDLSLGSPRHELYLPPPARLAPEQRGWPPFGGLPELRAAVAAKLRVDNDLIVDPDREVLITAGAFGAAQLALDAFLNPGDRVLLFDPSSPLYALAIQARRGRIRWLPSWVEDGATRFRFAQFQKMLRGCRLLVLNSPSNPTGGILTADDLEQIAWWARRRDVLILSDEVFERFQYDDLPVSIGTLPGGQERTMTVGSVSKSHALASARVGWLAGPRDLLLPCRAAALREPFVPTLCQQVALSALTSQSDGFRKVLAGFESRRRYAYDRLRALELPVAWPAGAHFFWVPVWQLGESGRDFADGLLRAQRVRVTPGDLFGPSGAGYVRISYAIEEGRLLEGLNRLAEFLEEPVPESGRRVQRAA